MSVKVVNLNKSSPSILKAVKVFNYIPLYENQHVETNTYSLDLLIKGLNPDSKIFRRTVNKFLSQFNRIAGGV